MPTKCSVLQAVQPRSLNACTMGCGWSDLSHAFACIAYFVDAAMEHLSLGPIRRTRPAAVLGAGPMEPPSFSC